MVYMGIALAAALWFILFRSSWGIAIRSIGEDPAAADSLGVKVALVRYLCVFLGGVLSGMAGAYLSIVYRPSWTEGMTGGMGWIVIALTIFSFWNPLAAIGGAYLFGALFYLSYKLQPYLAPELLDHAPLPRHDRGPRPRERLGFPQTEDGGARRARTPLRQGGN